MHGRASDPDAAERVSRGFDAERPLAGYAALAGAYAVLLAGGLAAARRRGGLLEELPPADLAVLTVGAHRLSRTLSREKVTRPLRRPFTVVREDAAAPPAELDERTRTDRGTLGRAIGDLLTCTLCLDQWTASALLTGYLVAPRVTRTLAVLLTMRAGADALQLAHGRLAGPAGAGVSPTPAAGTGVA